jgi:hypothetical protein
MENQAIRARVEGGDQQSPKAGQGSVAADFVCRMQFDDIWSRTHSRSGEQQLLLAVLERAVLDLFKFRYARRRREQRLYRESYEWVAADDQGWPFSFVNVCVTMGLSVEALRRQLLEGDWNFLEQAA